MDQTGTLCNVILSNGQSDVLEQGVSIMDNSLSEALGTKTPKEGASTAIRLVSN